MLASKIAILALGVLWLASANINAETTANLPDSQIFKFKFEINKPLVYAIDYKSRTVNDFSSGARSSLVKNSSEMHYKIRLTATGTNDDGTTTVYFEPFDFAQDVEIVNASGRSTISTRGLDIVSKQNDIVIVDTKRGIGLGQANNLKLPIYPFLLSGYFKFDPAGNIKNLDGDLPFIDMWLDNLKNKVGFFNIVFPTNSISTKGSWTNTVILKRLAGTTFNGDGVIQPNVFVRELDSTADAASFSLYESDNYKNLGGYIEQSGQQTSLVYPDRTESMNATFRFDKKLGRLIDMKKNDNLEDSVNLMIQGNSSSGHNNIEIESSMRLVSP